MKGIIMIVCIIAAEFQPLVGVNDGLDKHTTINNADHYIEDTERKLDNIASADNRPREQNQSSTKDGLKRTTGFRILYPFRFMLSSLGEVSKALSTLVDTLVTVFDHCIRNPVRIVKIFLCGFIDAITYLLLDIFLNVVNRSLIIIVWIPHGLFNFLLNVMPLEEIITYYVSIAHFVLHEVVLKVATVGYWSAVFVAIASFSGFILHQTRIITVHKLPTGRQDIKSIFLAMTVQNVKLWITNTTTMQYTFITLFTLFMSYHSFYTFIPASSYILRNYILRIVPVIYWIFVVVITSNVLCKVGLLAYKQKHVVLHPLFLTLSSWWTLICTNKRLMLILQEVFDRPVCHVVYTAVYPRFKSLVGHKSRRTALSLINPCFVLIRRVFSAIFIKMGFFLPWFQTVKERIILLDPAKAEPKTTRRSYNTSHSREDSQRESTRRSYNTSHSREDSQRESIALHTENKKEKKETTGPKVLHTRKRHRRLDSSNTNSQIPLAEKYCVRKESNNSETKSVLENTKTIGGENKFDHVNDTDDDDDADEFQETHETDQEDDTVKLQSGNIHIILSSLDTDCDQTKPVHMTPGGNLYIHDEVEDKPIWGVVETILE